MRIRLAGCGDLDFLEKLLYQVAAVHADIRPDLFKRGAKKYTREALEALLKDEDRPVFVAEDGDRKLGYAFCVLEKHVGDGAMQDFTSLYIDDLCVDECARGRHVGQTLYEYVKGYAREKGCKSITLNVWQGNDAARAFYDKMGLVPLKTTLEARL